MSFTLLNKNAVLPLYYPNYLPPLSYFRCILAILAVRQEGIIRVIFRLSSSLAPYRIILSSKT